MNSYALVLGAPPSGSFDHVDTWIAGPGEAFDSSVDGWLTQFGPVAEAAIDLSRVCMAAFLADQRFGRDSTWARELEVAVEVQDSVRMEAIRDELEVLLFWLTGDDWRLSFLTRKRKRPKSSDVAPAENVALLSGGLDSACGAALSGEDVLYIGHWDNKAVGHAQKATAAALESLFGGPPRYVRIAARIEAAQRREATTRSRSLLFMALAVAAATGVGAATVLVPENGFTSLNPPLGANRGGAYTTRSTHPTTFVYLAHILAALDLDVNVINPHFALTKGEILSEVARQRGVDAVEGLVRGSLSCAKLLGHRFKGGNPNIGCGTCIACMTRRGAVRSALGHDPTEYLYERLYSARKSAPENFAAWQKFSSMTADVDAVRAHIGWRPSDHDLVAIGPLPDDFDEDAALKLLDRGMKELVGGLP